MCVQGVAANKHTLAVIKMLKKLVDFGSFENIPSATPLLLPLMQALDGRHDGVSVKMTLNPIKSTLKAVPNIKHD